MKLLLSPRDKSLANPELRIGVASYAYNAQLFVPEASGFLNPTWAAINDGQSNTVLITEHYAFDCGSAQFLWIWSRGSLRLPVPGSNNVVIARRSSFADIGDVTPAPTPPPVTFQLQPKIGDCDPRVPQAPFHGGLLVGLGDGSVRMLNPNISPGTFWAAVTPAGAKRSAPTGERSGTWAFFPFREGLHF